MLIVNYLLITLSYILLAVVAMIGFILISVLSVAEFKKRRHDPKTFLRTKPLIFLCCSLYMLGKKKISKIKIIFRYLYSLLIPYWVCSSIFLYFARISQVRLLFSVMLLFLPKSCECAFEKITLVNFP